MTQNPGNSTDLAYTLACHREVMPHRAFVVLNPDGAVVETSPTAKAPTPGPEVIMVFSGQGAQWPGMGRQLFESDKDFKNDILEMNRLLKSLLHPPSWNLQGERAPASHFR